MKHEYAGDNSKSSGPKKDAPSQLLEQFVAATSKIDTEHLSRSLSNWAKGPINLVEEILKAYQRLAPGAVQHQIIVVERLLALCGSSSHPVKHARMLVEKAKLTRLASSVAPAIVSLFATLLDLVSLTASDSRCTFTRSYKSLES